MFVFVSYTCKKGFGGRRFGHFLCKMDTTGKDKGDVFNYIVKHIEKINKVKDVIVLNFQELGE